MKVLVIHGPNLNLLGRREPEIYGRLSLEEINLQIRQFARENAFQVDIFQSNGEGEIVTKIQEAAGQYDALVINPGAYTHTSLAIRDAVAAGLIPCIEVHLSNIFGREEHRKRSYLSEVAAGQISGFGPMSYILGLMAAQALVEAKR